MPALLSPTIPHSPGGLRACPTLPDSPPLSPTLPHSIGLHAYVRCLAMAPTPVVDVSELLRHCSEVSYAMLRPENIVAKTRKHAEAGRHVIMTGRHVIMTGRHVIMTGRHVIMTGRHVIMTGRHVIMTGRHVIMTGRHVIMTGRHVIMTGRHVIMTGRHVGHTEQRQWARRRS